MAQTAAVPSAPSLRRRALLAVALTVGFYLLALGIALALIGAPIALFATSGSGNIWIAIAMIGAGVAILRAIIPERDRFDPPGPELTREQQPRLHELLDDVATRVGEPPADAVYLDLPVNAAVLEHRGKRLMLLGLPLLATLEKDELQAVVAHEYGHYTGGDTRFSGWIWRTRVAVLKSVQRLVESDSWFRRNVVRWPFEWYAKLFLRITNALSRRAEFAADAVSAAAASADAAGRALRRVEAVSPAFDRFWSADVAPMLERERRPAIASGFSAMTAHTELASMLDDVVRTDLEGREPDPYASHPTLRQRLEALDVPVEGAAPAPAGHPASELLADLPDLERQLLTHRFGDEVGAFAPVDWQDAADVHLVRLRDLAERFGEALPQGLTIGEAGTVAADLPSRRQHLRDLLTDEDWHAPAEAIDAMLVDVLASSVTLAADRSGATVTAVPGEPTRIRGGDGQQAVDPWEVLGLIATDEAQPQSWTDHPVVRDLATVPLRAETRGTAELG